MLSRLMTRREQVVIGFLGASILTGALVLMWPKADPPDGTVIIEPLTETGAADTLAPTAPPETPAAEPEPRELIVSVQGAVVRPGVYHVDDGSRVQDLIQAAGGLSRADTSNINLAARAVDGTTLTIPPRRDAGDVDFDSAALEVANPAVYTISGHGAAALGQAGSADAGLINLNTATQTELETLPGIGPKLAQQIIQYRTGGAFSDISELMDVPGFGQKRLDSLKDLVTVE